MARCAHDQSDYKLRQLPRCSKCKVEMQLILISYVENDTPVWEWECRKCFKAVARHKLKELNPTPFEKHLNEWCEDDRKQREQRRQSCT